MRIVIYIHPLRLYDQEDAIGKSNFLINVPLPFTDRMLTFFKKKIIYKTLNKISQKKVVVVVTLIFAYQKLLHFAAFDHEGNRYCF